LPIDGNTLVYGVGDDDQLRQSEAVFTAVDELATQLRLPPRDLTRSNGKDGSVTVNAGTSGSKDSAAMSSSSDKRSALPAPRMPADFAVHKAPVRDLVVSHGISWSLMVAHGVV